MKLETKKYRLTYCDGRTEDVYAVAVELPSTQLMAHAGAERQRPWGRRQSTGGGLVRFYDRGLVLAVAESGIKSIRLVDVIYAEQDSAADSEVAS